MVCQTIRHPSQPTLITVPGPDGIELRFSGLDHGLYRHAEVIRPRSIPVALKLQPLSAWSLRLWSLDGRYVVLTTYILENGKVDLRNTRAVAAYDTSTGDLAQFAGRSGLLGNDSFVQWSPTYPDVALLDTGRGSKTEEAYRRAPRP
jgi:hypothetical protein